MRTLAEYCAEMGAINQSELARVSEVHQTTARRALLGEPLANLSAQKILRGLNKLRTAADLPLVRYEDIAW